MTGKRCIGSMLMSVVLGCGPSAANGSSGGNGGDGGMSVEELESAWVGTYARGFTPGQDSNSHFEFTFLPNGMVESRRVDCMGMSSQVTVQSWRVVEEGVIEVFAADGGGVSYVIDADALPCGVHRGYQGGNRDGNTSLFYEGSYCARKPRDVVDSSTYCIMDPCDERAMACEEEYTQ